MSLARTSIWISHLLALTAFVTLTLSEAIPLPLFLAGSAFIFGNLWGRFRGWSVPFSRRFWNVITVFFFIFFVIDSLWISQSIIDGGVHFLIYLMIVKLLTLQSAKDDLQLHLIAFFQLLATASWTNDLSFALGFVLFLVLTTWSLIFYHLRKEEEAEERVIPFGNVREGLTAPFFFWTNCLTVLALAITLFIFFSIPRVGTGLLESSQGRSVHLSGFSERVKLGSIGPVKLDPAVVMRVSLPQATSPPGLPVYLRGTAFDRYRAGTWENTFVHPTPLQRTGLRFQVPHGRPFSPAPRGTALQQDITLEPVMSSVLFAASQPLFIEGRLTEVMTDPSGTLRLAQAPAGKITYQAVSLSAPILPEETLLGEIPYPEEIRDRYLQMEEQENLSALARRITEGRDTVYSKTLAVQRFLMKNYRYNLNVPVTESSNPIDVFLFDRKEGYCEHFASAMVLLLRQAGIASRLVSGFLSTEWNPFGNYLLVRQQDAHTWVEVYFPKSGWVLFDPTPPSPGSGEHTLLSAYIDWVRTRWDRYVVRYTILDQITFVRDSWQWMKGPSGESGSNRPWNSILSSKVRSWWILLVLGGIGLWLARVLTHSTGNLPGKRSVQEAEATRAYRRFLKLMSKKGWRRLEGETPSEFASSLPLRTPIKESVCELTALYYRARFGPTGRDPQLLERLQSVFEGIKEGVDEIPAGPSSRPRPDTPKGGSGARPNGDAPLGSHREKGR